MVYKLSTSLFLLASCSANQFEALISVSILKLTPKQYMFRNMAIHERATRISSQLIDTQSDYKPP